MLTGPAAQAKTYVACALGQQACMRGYSVRYYRLTRIILSLTQAKADGASYSRLLKAITSLDLLIIDDWGLEGLEPLNAGTRNNFMEIMDDCYQQSATIMICQLQNEQWYDVIVNDTLGRRHFGSAGCTTPT